MNTAGDMFTSVLKPSHVVSVLETRLGEGPAVCSPWPPLDWVMGTVQRGRDVGFRSGSFGSPCPPQCACRHGYLAVPGGACRTLPGPSCSPHYKGDGVTRGGRVRGRRDRGIEKREIGERENLLGGDALTILLLFFLWN